MNKTYAGIGTRATTPADRELLFDTAAWLAKRDWHLFTGAAVGADQAFAEGALSVGGKVTLCLPWPSYEWKWVKAHPTWDVQIVGPYHDLAWDSVDLYHPNASQLKDSVRSLHARNYLIVDDRKFIIALPKLGPQGLGGTGQGIRVAEGLGIPIIRLDDPDDRERITSKIYAQ